MCHRHREDPEPQHKERIPLSTCITWGLLIVVVILVGLVLTTLHQLSDETKSARSGDHKTEILAAVKQWMEEQRSWMEKKENTYYKSIKDTLQTCFKDNIATARMNTLREECEINSDFSCSYCSTAFTSCEDVLEQFPGSPSAYYYIIASNGHPVHFYCNMTLTCGNITGGWRRVGYLNMNNEGAVYLPRLINDQPVSSHGCSSVIFQSFGISHTSVCGKINAFQENSLNGFKYKDCVVNPTLDSNYVDGVSLTHNNNGVRSHIWTLAAEANCQFSKTGVPEFVGNHFSLDSGNDSELLWDDDQCSDSPSRNSAWFYRKLEQQNHDDIEMRLCGGQPQDDLLLTNVEIYVY